MGMNGTTAQDLMRRGGRYFVQWVTEHDKTESGAASIKVIGWCIRDHHSRDWATVFEHTDRQVCEKMLKILNEG